MKPTLSIAIPARLLLVALLFSSVHAASIPGVEITYDERADSQCSGNVGRAVRPEWVSELQSRLPELRVIWQSVGPSMSQAVSELTNKPFVPNDAVKLTLCDVTSNAIEQVIAIDSQLPSGCYKRAWTLVNATEGTYKQFVGELAQ